MGVFAGGLACDPTRRAIRRRQLAVEREGRLQRHPRPSGPTMLEVGRVEGFRLFGQNPFLYLDPLCCRNAATPCAGHPGIGIRSPRSPPLPPRLRSEHRRRGGPPEMGAGLERHDHRPAAGCRSGRCIAPPLRHGGARDRRESPRRSPSRSDRGPRPRPGDWGGCGGPPPGPTPGACGRCRPGDSRTPKRYGGRSRRTSRSASWRTPSSRRLSPTPPIAKRSGDGRW